MIRAVSNAPGPSPSTPLPLGERGGLFVNRLESTPVLRFTGGEEALESWPRRRAVLKTPLREDRHLAAGDRFHAAGDNVALVVIEPVMTPIRELDKRHGLGHGDDVGQRVRTETLEAETTGRS